MNHINYNPYKKRTFKNTQKTIRLLFDDTQLGEIVRTAKEGKGLVTSSKIDQQAMGTFATVEC